MCIRDRAGLATLLGIFSLGGLGFGLAMSLVFRFLLLQYRVWRFHRQNPILFGEVELVLGNDGVEFTDSRSAARYSWTDVKGYKESGKGFLLRLSKMCIRDSSQAVASSPAAHRP